MACQLCQDDREAGCGLQAEPRGTLCSFYLFILSAGGIPGPPYTAWPRLKDGRQGQRDGAEEGVQGSGKWHNMSMSVKQCLNKF